MSCCRSSKALAPKARDDNPHCSKCSYDMESLFNVAAAQQVTSRRSSEVKVSLNCPKCNTKNTYKVKVTRTVTPIKK